MAVVLNLDPGTMPREEGDEKNDADLYLREGTSGKKHNLAPHDDKRCIIRGRKWIFSFPRWGKI